MERVSMAPEAREGVQRGIEGPPSPQEQPTKRSESHCAAAGQHPGPRRPSMLLPGGARFAARHLSLDVSMSASAGPEGFTDAY